VAVLSDLVKTRVNYVVQESVIVIKDIFRRYPRKYEKIIVTLCDNLESLNEPEAKASMIWIIGEYAERIVDAGDRLEHFLDSFEEEGAMVQLQLLTSTVKLFLKKPDKAKALVQKVLNLATESSDNPDLRDRGYVYWRLLSTDPTAARKVVLAERPVISAETFSLPQEYLTLLLANLSSLASVYHRPPEEFVRGSNNVIFHPFEEEKAETSSDDNSDSGTSDDEEESSGEEEEDSSEESSDDKRKKSKKNAKKKKSPKKKASPQQTPVEAAPAVQAQSQPVDLLGDMFGSSAASQNNPVQNNAATAQTSGGGGGGGGDDLFGDMFGDPSPAQNANSAPSVPMTQVVDAQKGQGLSISVGLSSSAVWARRWCFRCRIRRRMASLAWMSSSIRIIWGFSPRPRCRCRGR